MKVLAQEVRYNNFEKFNTENGLPQNHINRIEQDRDGFIWLATPSGLARFDGKNFLIFDADSDRREFLSTSNIRDFLIDEDNRLWIVHINGKVDLMDPESFQVERDLTPIYKIPKDQFPFSRNGSSSWIMGNRQKGSWFIEVEENYLLFEDSNTSLVKAFQQHTISEPNFGFRMDASGGLWEVSRDSIRYRNESKMTKTSFALPANIDLKFGKITYVYLNPFDEDRLFFSCNSELYIFNKSTHTFQVEEIPQVTHLWNKGILPASGATQWVNGRFIFAYQGYVFQLDPIALKVSVLWESPQSNVFPVSTLMLTNEKTLWVGVSGDGLYKVNLLTPSFRYAKYEENFLTDLLTREMNVDEATIPTNWKKRSGPYGLRSFSKDNRLYLTSEQSFGNGRRAYVLTNGQIAPMRIPGPSPKVSFMGIGGQGEEVSALDQDGWLYTWSDPSNEPEVKHIIPIFDIEGRINARINDLVIDDQYQWVLSNRVQLIQFQDGNRIATFEPGSGKSAFISLKQDPREDSILWIGTLGDGLIRWNKQTLRTSRKYTIDDGMIDDRIASIEFDDSNQLWLATFNGIIKFNKEKGAFSNYTKSDGIQESEFNRHHTLHLLDGRIAFGGSLGYTIFDPKYFMDDPYQPKTNVVSMFLNDVPVIDSEEADFDSQSVNQITQLTLPYNNNLLTLELASSAYNNISKTNYRYQLSGNTNGWVNLGGQRIVRLGKLAPGQYTLTVNVSNSQGIWSDSQKQIALTITPPPWLTWWAFLIYAIVIVILSYAYWQKYRRKIIRQQEEAFNKREAKRLLEIDRIKTRFFSNITHEFRTPLTLILSPLEKYLEDVDQPAGIRKLLRSNYDNASRLLKLVNQLLDIAKVESGHMRSHQATGDLLSFVKQNIDRFAEASEEKGLTLHFESTLTEGNYEFDQNNFEQIIQNLLSNAIKFTEPNGQVSVRLFLSDPGSKTLTFEVEDNGVGIPEESMTKLFDRFYQVDDTSTRVHEGTGIGLALVKELADLMGGTVAVKSTEGVGSKFTVNFPVKKLSEEDDSKEREAPIELSEQQNTASDLLILVVEDNDELRAFLIESMAGQYQVLGAKDGREAWKLVEQELPDVIISDVMMPYLNGFELCQKVKADTRTMHVQVILLTAKASQAAREEGLGYGADEYLTKPFHPKELDLRLSNFKEKRAALQRHLTNTLLPGKMTEALPKVEDLFVQGLIEVLEKNMKDPQLGVALLAEELNMSKSTLNRKMRAIFNLPTNQFIRDYRIQQSTHLLLSGYSVADAAYEVGFESPSYFAQCFKGHFQKSPSEFQKSPV